MHKKDLTYSDAMEQVMLHNGFFASLKLLYKEVWNYKDKTKITGITPDNTIQERAQRDSRFTRIAKGVYALTQFIENAEKNDLGYFVFNQNKVIFKQKKVIKKTEKIVEQKIRIGQNYFRKSLIQELEKCPITQINEKRLLIASHIKPWVHSNNKERIDYKNGLLLSPLYDKLFDKGIGLITFTLDKRILISNKLSKENISRLNIQHNQIIPDLPIAGRERFLKYHRQYIFQG
ncbi:MAG: HNH endonuclease [Candidatus Pacebacteria bacterium]|nr:HNH endonuclease [Candidatus Paceibacterota bacterium]